MTALRFDVLHTPTREFALAATRIGSEAWRDRFPGYTEEQRRNVFDPDHPERVLARMEQAATIGAFVGVLAVQETTNEAIGVVWGAEDISAGTVAEREAKRAAGKVYAWSAQMNVLPAEQRNGVGAAALDTFLSEFDEDMRPTSYVFRSNRPTMKWHRRIGYKPTPHPVFPMLPAKPTPKWYFGEDARPVRQVRLVGPSTRVIRANIAERYPQLPGLEERTIVHSR